MPRYLFNGLPPDCTSGRLYAVTQGGLDRAMGAGRLSRRHRGFVWGHGRWHLSIRAEELAIGMGGDAPSDVTEEEAREIAASQPCDFEGTPLEQAVQSIEEYLGIDILADVPPEVESSGGMNSDAIAQGGRTRFCSHPSCILQAEEGQQTCFAHRGGPSAWRRAELIRDWGIMGNGIPGRYCAWKDPDGANPLLLKMSHDGDQAFAWVPRRREWMDCPLGWAKIQRWGPPANVAPVDDAEAMKITGGVV